MTLPPEAPNAHQSPYIDDEIIVVPADDLSVAPKPYDTGSHESDVKAKAADTKDEAVNQASDVKDSAVAAGTHVADVAKDQAGSVVAEAGNQVKSLLSQTRGELSSQVGSQQQRLAGGLHSLGDEVRGLAEGNGGSGIATEVAHQVADRTKSVASWFENREPTDVLQDVAAFARRRPGLFIALAAGTGILVGRLARSLRDDAAPDSTPSHSSQRGDVGGYDAPVAGYAAPTSGYATPVSGYDAPAYDGGVR